MAGFTPGELSVDQSGGAGYTLPIGIPAGVAGMQPELSINYSSGNGNGLLGVGFSLGGLSAITRCGRTIVQDGAVGGVEFTNSDRFCLNGQRLVAISGEYGQSDTEYRTEIDSMARIISHDRQGNGPAWFSIETKSGQTIEFGNTKDSRIEAQGKSSAFAWAQNKLVDAVGNEITITYEENNANTEYYPLHIDYSDNSVRFEYEDKEYTWVSYLAGSSVKATKRMSKVNTWHGENKLGEYRFSYDIRDNKPALLTSIQQCDGGNNCFPATTFDWQQPGEGFGEHLLTSDICANGSTANGVCNDGDNFNSITFLDLNQDGKSDLVYRGDKGITTFLSTGTGFQLASTSDICGNTRGSVCNDGDNHQYIFYPDINGD
ncbi:MAG: SpvB/TcaC N-terminal domain-containing protein, partial [Candidatus Sedimenticola sp. (ex Thyasira tokunagai)]